MLATRRPSPRSVVASRRRTLARLYRIGDALDAAESAAVAAAFDRHGPDRVVLACDLHRGTFWRSDVFDRRHDRAHPENVTVRTMLAAKVKANADAAQALSRNIARIGRTHGRSAEDVAGLRAALVRQHARLRFLVELAEASDLAPYLHGLTAPTTFATSPKPGGRPGRGGRRPMTILDARDLVARAVRRSGPEAVRRILRETVARPLVGAAV